MSSSSAEPAVKVLFVCTGNLCRSAAAERLLLAWAAADTGRSVAVRSAGTRARFGRAIHPSTERALRRHRVPADGFSSRPLFEDDVEWADLVLTMTGQHREDVLAVSPRGLHKCFTLLEAAALCSAMPEQRVRRSRARRGEAVAATLREVRHQFARAQGPDYDIVDPIDGPEDLHVAVVDQIAAALQYIRPVLAGMDGEPPTVRMPRLPPVPRAW
jgi:protein-tyrosine-phosphatase